MKEKIILGNRQPHVPRLHNLEVELYNALGISNRILSLSEYAGCTEALKKTNYRYYEIYKDVDGLLEHAGELLDRGAIKYDGYDFRNEYEYLKRYARARLPVPWPDKNTLYLILRCYTNIKKLFEIYDVEFAFLWGGLFLQAKNCQVFM